MPQDESTDYAITQPRFAIPLIVVVSGLIFFWALGEAAYWDRDEPRNAGCAAEMMARGDWIVPTFNDELRQQKPVLLYWLMGVAYSIFGVNEFAGRFFSALLAVGTVVATWGIARSFFDRATALLASLMLATSLMFVVAARAATPDSVLIFCVTAALWFFARGHAKGQSNPFASRASFTGIYLSLGFAMLAKGPVGIVLPMAVMGWFLLQQDSLSTTAGKSSLARRIVEPFHPVRFWRTLISMRIFSGTLIALLVAAPWFVAVGIATDGEFLRRFFLDENFGRATKVLESHSGGFWFYPLAILVGFFPWSVFWGPVAADICKRTLGNGSSSSPARLNAGTRFAVCWIIIQVVAFSLVRTKLPSYVTPCYPALVMLTAHVMMREFRSQGRSPNWLWHVAYGAMLAGGIGISASIWFASNKLPVIPTWLIVIGIVPMAMGVIFGLAHRTSEPSVKFKLGISAALGAAIFCVGLLGSGAASVGKDNRMALVSLIRQQPNANTAAYGCLESSWVYYSDKRIIELRTDGNEESGADQRLNDREFWQRKPWLSPRQFAESTNEAMIITTDEYWPSLKKQLPEDWEVIQTADWFLKNKQLLLIGNRKVVASQPDQLLTR